MCETNSPIIQVWFLIHNISIYCAEDFAHFIPGDWFKKSCLPPFTANNRETQSSTRIQNFLSDTSDFSTQQQRNKPPSDKTIESYVERHRCLHLVLRRSSHFHGSPSRERCQRFCFENSFENTAAWLHFSLNEWMQGSFAGPIFCSYIETSAFVTDWRHFSRCAIVEFEGARAARTQPHPSINCLSETASRTVPVFRRDRSARAAVRDPARSAWAPERQSR